MPLLVPVISTSTNPLYSKTNIHRDPGHLRPTPRPLHKPLPSSPPRKLRPRSARHLAPLYTALYSILHRFHLHHKRRRHERDHRHNPNNRYPRKTKPPLGLLMHRFPDMGSRVTPRYSPLTTAPCRAIRERWTGFRARCRDRPSKSSLRAPGGSESGGYGRRCGSGAAV